jgi:hypothetical protein
MMGSSVHWSSSVDLLATRAINFMGWACGMGTEKGAVEMLCCVSCKSIFVCRWVWVFNVLAAYTIYQTPPLGALGLSLAFFELLCIRQAA